MDCDDYLNNYKILEETTQQNSNIKFHRIEKKYASQIEPYYLMRNTNYKYFLNEQHAKSMLNVKLFNILQPHDTIIHQNNILIIMKDWRQYRLSENQLNQQNIKFILFQLAITLSELSLKNITWNLYSIEQLYLIQDCVFLQLIDLEDNHFSMNISNINIFKSFIRKYFPQFTQILDAKMDKFEKIIYYLINQFDLKINQQTHYGLNHLFKIQQITSSQGIDDIYTVEFSTPKIFETVFEINQKSILYRSYDLSRNNRNQQLEYQNREIQITEKLSNTSNISINFSYLRIFNQTFFFQKKCIMSIAEAASLNKPQYFDNPSYRKIAYRALNEIIRGIATFHSEQIMHRNISPQTIYIDDENLSNAHFYIGDQEKAKEETNIFQGTQQCTSYQYLPPESMEYITMKSDIYQFGLVALFILNKGTPLFPFCFLDSEEIEKQFNPTFINNKFKENNFEYSEQLIKLIAQCLKQNPKERPETSEVQKQVAQVYRSLRIRICGDHAASELTMNQQGSIDLFNQLNQYFTIKMTYVSP